MIEKIIKELKANARPYSEIKSFSNQPGIYAFFFYGKTFPLKNFQCASNDIIYIGKTLKSQKSRDADTHFKTGKTGSSTVRKTFGSLLYEQYKLNAIPRSQSDIEKRRNSHFKFDDKSEKQLTQWMVENLGLSFYPYPKSKEEIDDLETLLINHIVPILNIDRKNTVNIHFSSIRLLRKKLSEIAYANHGIERSNPIKEKLPKVSVVKRKDSNIKYEDIWESAKDSIIGAIKNNKELNLQLDKDDFAKVGNRKSYSFNLEFINGKVSNNIGGSAVARDLARVLANNVEFKKLAIGKELKFKMGKDFTFQMS
jgi:hypothetical protein